jgi:hypothetical protein
MRRQVGMGMVCTVEDALTTRDEFEVKVLFAVRVRLATFFLFYMRSTT